MRMHRFAASLALSFTISTLLFLPTQRAMSAVPTSVGIDAAPYSHAYAAKGIDLEVTPCTSSHVVTVPSSISTIDEARRYALAHPSEVRTFGCPYGFDLGVGVDVFPGQLDDKTISDLTYKARLAFFQAIKAGSNQVAALVPAVLAFNGKLTVSADMVPASNINPLTCSSGSNQYMSNIDTVPGNGYITWEFWYNSSGAGCNHTFQQTKYSFYSGANIWVQWGQVHTSGNINVFTWGSAGCGTCHTNIPVTYSFGANNTAAWPLAVNTFYCRNVDSGGNCNNQFEHPDDNLPN